MEARDEGIMGLRAGPCPVSFEPCEDFTFLGQAREQCLGELGVASANLRSLQLLVHRVLDQDAPDGCSFFAIEPAIEAFFQRFDCHSISCLIL